jgi:hypothetical protein
MVLSIEDAHSDCKSHRRAKLEVSVELERGELNRPKGEESQACLASMIHINIIGITFLACGELRIPKLDKRVVTLRAEHPKWNIGQFKLDLEYAGASMNTNRLILA